MRLDTRGSLFTPTRDRALILAWVVGFAVAVVGAYAVLGAGAWGIDSHLYWSLADRHPLYDQAPGQPYAYLYSPLFAQLMTPLSLLPPLVFAWGWFAAGVGAYWWLTRPVSWAWRLPLLACVVDDLRTGNVMWLLTLACALGVRYPPAWLIGTFTKIAPSLGAVWFLVRGEWRAIAQIVGVGAVLLVVSVAASPDLWTDWVAFLRTHSNAWAAARLVLGVALVIWAARRGSAWMLPLALIAAEPVWWVYSLAYLCAIPRLLPAEAVAWANAPFGGVRATLRRALDLT